MIALARQFVAHGLWRVYLGCPLGRCPFMGPRIHTLTPKPIRMAALRLAERLGAVAMPRHLRPRRPRRRA